ncbi:MAG: TlpA disulfide reductase family protein [Candidatus Omnitrophota bacterium]|nr:TlpA disulfide reductase family protein [Candidatus Omnitrophota bacterium]
MKFIKGFISIAVLFLAVGCSSTGAIEIGSEAPDFSLPNIEGKQVSLSSFKGKVIILDFFASWCPPCKQEVPDFIALQKAYGAEGFAVIGVALVNAKDAKNFAQEFGVNYPILVDDGKVSNLYGPIRSIPTTFILDKSGKIVKLYIGFRPKSVFEADIKELLK